MFRTVAKLLQYILKYVIVLFGISVADLPSLLHKLPEYMCINVFYIYIYIEYVLSRSLSL
jgi:hypothetical protein